MLDELLRPDGLFDAEFWLWQLRSCRDGFSERAVRRSDVCLIEPRMSQWLFRDTGVRERASHHETRLESTRIEPRHINDHGHSQRRDGDR